MLDREVILLGGGIVLLLGIAFVLSRVLKSLDHGFSIRLQMFFGIWTTSLLATGVIGFWVIDRLQVRAAELALREGPSMQVIVEILREFGPKITLLVALLSIASAGAAFAFGRAVAQPIERLTRSAQRIARGEGKRGLPAPIGREVRALTDAMDSMRNSLEEGHKMEAFVADLSHELKNPVAAIKAATEVLMEGAADDPINRHRFLARIDEASHRLEILTQDLLALARLEARGAQVQQEVLVLAEVIEAAKQAYMSEAESKGIRIETKLESMRIRGDRNWLIRAVGNLLANALRYSPSKTRVQLSLTAEDEMAVIRVIDEGPGIDPNLREKVFDRFVTDRKTADQTGLGLAIARSIAELHGGTAQVIEHDGSGACLELRLLMN